MKRGIGEIPELRLLGETFAVFSFASDELNMYEVLDQMSHRGWALTGLQHPAAIHVSATLRHAQPGVAERFVKDLKASVEHVAPPTPAPTAAWPRSTAWPQPYPIRRSSTICSGK